MVDLSVLTDAERSVAELVADGYHPLEVARRRDTALCTVKRQLEDIYDKLHFPQERHYKVYHRRSLLVKAIIEHRMRGSGNEVVQVSE